MLLGVLYGFKEWIVIFSVIIFEQCSRNDNKMLVVLMNLK